MSSQLKSVVDLLLTGVSSQYIPNGYISEQVLPFVPVDHYTGKLAKYGLDHVRAELSMAGGKGVYRRVDSHSRSQVGYSLEGHGLEDVITKADYANTLDPYNAEQDVVIGLTHKLWIEKELALATNLGSTSVMTQNTTLSGTSQLSDYDNSDPLSVFKTARKAVKDGCGMWPNQVVMDSRTADVIRFHPQIMDHLGYKYNRPGGLENSELARALNVDKVLVANADYNSAAQGQTDSLGAIWGKDIIFMVAPEGQSIRQVSLGYMLGLRGQSPRKVYKYPIYNPPDSTGVLCEDYYQFFLSNVAAGYLVKSAIA